MSNRTVTGLFVNSDTAAAAIRELEAMGVKHGDIGLIANQIPTIYDRDHREVKDAIFDVAPDEAPGVGTAASVGAVTGASVGFFAGIGALLIPGFGPLISAGIFASTLGGAAIGAATGGIAGLLTEAGVNGDHANFYNDQVKNHNRALVTVKVSEQDVPASDAILDRHGRMLPPIDDVI